MRNISLYLLFVLLLQSIVSCKSYSKYPIDSKAVIKKDSSLLGIWKAAEDTDNRNFILVQSRYDLIDNERWWLNTSPADKRKAILEQRPDIDREFLENAIKPTSNDTLRYIKDYTEFLEQQDYYYYLTYINNHGTGPEYQQWGTFTSIVNNMKFLNVAYRNTPFVNGEFVKGKDEEGYFFVRIININPTYDTITTAVIADSTLKYLSNCAGIRKRIEQKGSMSAFYSDTMHFYKVSGYHLTINESEEIANHK